MPFFKMEMISLTLVLHWRTWNRSNCHCNYYNVSSFITFSQKLKYKQSPSWTWYHSKVLVTTLSRDESLILALVSQVESLVSQGKSLVYWVETRSSCKRVEKLQASKGLWNVYGLKDENNSVFCFSDHVMHIRPAIHGVNFDERIWLSCTVLLEPFYGKKTALKLFKVTFFV